MKAITSLEVGLNSHINEVLVAFVEIGEGKSDGGKTDIVQSQREICTLVARILTGVKVSLMQAGAIMNEMELGDIEVG